MANSDVSEEDTAHRSTSKTVCRLCRQRKTKCDRNLPKCSFCIKAKVVCQYVPEPRKRGLRAGYVTELESRIGKSSQLSYILVLLETLTVPTRNHKV